MTKGTGPPPPERRRIEVETDAEERLDAFLAGRLPVSRSRIAALVADGLVTVNGAPVRKSYHPVAGDRIEVEIPPPSPLDLEPEPIDVPIVFEDPHLIVVDKPAGLVVHPAPGHPTGTLVHALLALTDRLSPLGAPLRPGIVHRLDRDTSGLLVVAKSEEAHLGLSRDLARRRVGRGYLAAAWGRLEPEERTVDRPIGRSPSDRKRMAVVSGGRRAVTHLRRLERWPAADLLAVRLATGRTHQIRVHLADLGHPLVGDPVYGRGWERGITGASGRWAEELVRRCGRMFLHAARLVFRHPVTGERMTFTSPLPAPLSGAVDWARGGDG